MEVMFVESRYDEKFLLPNSVVERLPDKVCIATTIQFYDSLDGVKKQLEGAGKHVELFNGKHAKYPGQILGCSLNKQDVEVEAFLYLGTGEFHPKALMLVQEAPVIKYNPLSGKVEEISEQDVELMQKRMKGALLKFKTSEEIGIIVSTKPGQNRMVDGKKLKEELVKQGKKVYLFVTETLDFNELNNFPFVGCWVNTMCPRIGLDDFSRAEKPIINIDFLA